MSELRASDADRERTAERLRNAAAEGRLTADELEERLELAFGARTEVDLEPLTADLPATAGEHATGGRPARPSERRRLYPPPDFAPFVFVSLMLVGIWALTGMGYFWPVWPIGGWGISFLAPGRLRRSCRRRSSNPGSSTGRSPSSAAAGPGSAELPR